MYQVTFYDDWNGAISGVTYAESFDDGVACAVKGVGDMHHLIVEAGVKEDGTFRLRGALRECDGGNVLVVITDVPLVEPADTVPGVIDACNALAQGDIGPIRALFQGEMDPPADRPVDRPISAGRTAPHLPSNASPSIAGGIYQVTFYDPSEREISTVAPAETLDDGVARAFKGTRNADLVDVEMVANEDGALVLRVSEEGATVVEIANVPLAEPADTVPGVIDACNALAQGDNSLIKALFAPAPSRAARPRP